MTETATAPAAPAAEPTSSPINSPSGPINTDTLGRALSDALSPPARERAPDGKFKKRETAAAPETPVVDAATETPETPAVDATDGKTPETAADDGADPEIEITEEGDETTETPPSKVDAPSSWPAELRTVFAELKPDAQQKLKAWQEERDRGIDRTVNEAKESARKALESLEPEKKAIQTERQNLQAAIEHYASPKIAKFRADFADLLTGKITETQLVQDQAIRYAADGTDRWELYQAYQTELNGIARAAQYAQQKNEETRRAEFSKFRDTETAEYRKTHNLSDEAAWETHSEELHKFGEKVGFKPDELAYADARHMTVLRNGMEAARANETYLTEARKLGFKDGDLNLVQDAIRYRKALAGRRALEADPNQPIVPKVARPGVVTQQPSAESRQVTALKSKFNSSGKIDDLAKLLDRAAG